MATLDYSTWNAEQLLARVQALERDLKAANEKYRSLVVSQNAPLPEKASLGRDNAKSFDPSKYSTRMIALKFAYLGRDYNGLEYTPGNTTSQPTIEEALWAALRKARLIFPSDEKTIAAGQISWTGCDYSKCGRTDKGVSAFGQVVGLRVRSNRPISSRKIMETVEDEQNNLDLDNKSHIQEGAGADHGEPIFDPVKDELPYVQILNRLLPSDIRILAWCSDLPDDFSARFSCRERRYRYFFTNPAFAPTTEYVYQNRSKVVDTAGRNSCKEGWLDIQAMQDAAKRYEGLHDFRNLCKIDASKQLTDFRRRIFHSEIRELDPIQEPASYFVGQAFSELTAQPHANGTADSKMLNGIRMYEFVLYGSAFLWHQVRHMVAVLFLVGQGLETPDVVDKLLDIKNCPQKPIYNMADDAPLVLWDCIFPDLNGEDKQDSLKWIYAGEEPSPGSKPVTHKSGAGGLIDSLWNTWHKHKIDEVLAGSLLNLAASQNGIGQTFVPRMTQGPTLFLGGSSPSYKGAYIPLMQRPRGELPEVQNAKYAVKKGLTPKTEEDLQQLRNARRDKRQDHLEERHL